MYELKDYIRPAFVKLAVPAGFFLVWFMAGSLYGEPMMGILIGMLACLILLPVSLPWIKYWSHLFKLTTERSSEWREEVEKDFRDSKSFIIDRIRIGEKYVFVNKEGGILPRKEIKEFDYQRKYAKGTKFYWAVGYMASYGYFIQLSELSYENSENTVKQLVSEANAYFTESGS